MSRLDKEEIKDELEHLHEIVGVLKRNRRVRELQQAKYEVDAPPLIFNQIRDLTDQIREYEKEIAHLQVLVVEDEMSISEAEYRTLLAEVLQDGRLDVLGKSKVELTRLRLAISCEDANRIEYEVRRALAIENLNRVPKSLGSMSSKERQLFFSYRNEAVSDKRSDDTYRFLGRAILLDSSAVLELIRASMLKDGIAEDDINEYSLDNFFGEEFASITFIHNIKPGQEEYAALETFVNNLKEIFTQLIDPILQRRPRSPETPAPPPVLPFSPI